MHIPQQALEGYFLPVVLVIENTEFRGSVCHSNCLLTVHSEDGDN
jgi:hypothetical protein